MFYKLLSLTMGQRQHANIIGVLQRQQAVLPLLGIHPEQRPLTLWDHIIFVPSMYNRLFILLIQVGYLGIDVSPTSLPQCSTLLLLLIFVMYKHITWNTIYYHSHTFSLMMYNFSIMYTAWCLTLYHNPIYCWALSMYNYFNLLPIPL